MPIIWGYVLGSKPPKPEERRIGGTVPSLTLVMGKETEKGKAAAEAAWRLMLL